MRVSRFFLTLFSYPEYAEEHERDYHDDAPAQDVLLGRPRDALELRANVLEKPETTLLRRLLLRSLLDLLLDGFRRGLRLLAAVHGRVAFLGLLEEPLLRRLGRSSIGLGVLVRLGSGLFLQRLLLAGCACGRCLRSLCL